MFVIPISAGQDEACRRFAQALLGSRRPAYEASRRRVGVQCETVWLARTPAGELALVRLTADEPGSALARLAASELPFDRWFRDQWRALTGLELARSARLGQLEHIFEWNAAERSAAGQNVEPSIGIDQKETSK